MRLVSVGKRKLDELVAQGVIDTRKLGTNRTATRLYRRADLVRLGG